MSRKHLSGIYAPNAASPKWIERFLLAVSGCSFCLFLRSELQPNAPLNSGADAAQSPPSADISLP